MGLSTIKAGIYVYAEPSNALNGSVIKFIKSTDPSYFYWEWLTGEYAGSKGGPWKPHGEFKIYKNYAIKRYIDNI